MRRLLLPAILIAVAVAAVLLANEADDAANPGGPGDGDEARLTTPVLNARRIPAWLSQPESDSLLAAEVSAALAALPEAPDGLCVSVHRDGVDVITQAAPALVPGELQRLLVAAAAVEQLPAQNLYTTDVVMAADTEVVDGVLLGDLWIIGRGDPTLSTEDYRERFHASPEDTTLEGTDLAELADSLANRLDDLGVTAVSGAVLGDESRYRVERDYRGVPTATGALVWDDDDNAANAVGPLSALAVNDGFTAWPETIEPALNTRSPDPPATVAEQLAALLAERGIVVEGGTGNGDAPDLPTVLTNIVSPSRDVIVDRVLRNGTTAELLVKELGIRSGAEGDRGQGLVFGVYPSLTRLEVPVVPVAGEFFLADGSGISDQNTIPCESFAAILDHPDIGATIDAALPPATEGSLAECLPPDSDEMRLLATAAEDVVSVAGTQSAPNGDLLTFVMIANGPELGTSLGPCNSLQATFLDAIAGHPYVTDLDALSPAPASES